MNKQLHDALAILTKFVHQDAPTFIHCDAPKNVQQALSDVSNFVLDNDKDPLELPVVEDAPEYKMPVTARTAALLLLLVVKRLTATGRKQNTLSMEALYLSDASRINQIRTFIIEDMKKEARNFAERMDTAARDEIPTPVWNWLREN